MKNIITHLVDLSDQAPTLYCITTGAGAGLQQKIWQTPGVSNFFIGAQMPYDMDETRRILGFTPLKYVSIETAVDLALAAYLRALRPGRKAIGLGLTCSVASTREHKGDHRILAAAFTDDACHVYNFVIDKGVGAEQRLKDGELADQIALQALSTILKVPGSLMSHFDNQDVALSVRSAMEVAKRRILSYPYFRANGERGLLQDLKFEDTLFYPGAFNPPHTGHHQGAIAAQATHPQHRKIIFSTCINPPHKEPLSPAEMLQRVQMMQGHDFLLTENDPLFLDKSERYPGAHFVVGSDTLDRMLDPRWGIDPSHLLMGFRRNNTRLLVLGRAIDDIYMSGLDIARKHAKILEEQGREGLASEIRWGHENRGWLIPVDFRYDISSTQLRSKANDGKKSKSPGISDS